MGLAEIRKEIDRIDPQIRELLMQRMDQAALVAQTKVEAGETTIYRPDREADILKRLSEGVPAERLAEYLAVVRKVMEVCRMYEYDLMFDMMPGLFEPLAAGLTITGKETHVKIHFSRPDAVNNLSAVLCMIGDYGCNLEELKILERDGQTGKVEAVFAANLSDVKMQKLMFQLSKETQDFKIIEVF